jgi:hypothetical protein
VAANGDVANKIGTYMLALAAHDNGVPAYAVVPTSTIDLSLRDGSQIHRRAHEVLEVRFRGEQVAPAVRYARARPSTSPSRLITAIDREQHMRPYEAIWEDRLCLTPGLQALSVNAQPAPPWQGGALSGKTMEDDAASGKNDAGSPLEGGRGLLTGGRPGAPVPPAKSRPTGLSSRKCGAAVKLARGNPPWASFSRMKVCEQGAAAPFAESAD